MVADPAALLRLLPGDRIRVNVLDPSAGPLLERLLMSLTPGSPHRDAEARRLRRPGRD